MNLTVFFTFVYSLIIVALYIQAIVVTVRAFMRLVKAWQTNDKNGIKFQTFYIALITAIGVLGGIFFFHPVRHLMWMIRYIGCSV